MICDISSSLSRLLEEDLLLQAQAGGPSVPHLWPVSVGLAEPQSGSRSGICQATPVPPFPAGSGVTLAVTTDAGTDQEELVEETMHSRLDPLTA